MKEFMQQMSGGTAGPSFFQKRLGDHFGPNPATLPVVEEKLASYDQANLHLAIQAYLAEPGRSHELIGVASEHKAFSNITLSQLVGPPPRGPWAGVGLTQGPVEYTNVDTGNDSVLACVKSGLYLIFDNKVPLALHVTANSRNPMQSGLSLEAMATERAAAEEVLRQLREIMRKRNIFRGRVVSLEATQFGGINVCFYHLPTIGRSDIILPSGLLDRVERHTTRFSELSSTLRSAGRHLKRGLLLHGPPGTGKTLTAMHIAESMKNRTVILVTGRGQGLIEQCCHMARMLQPAIVIVEDVDLIGGERTQRGGCALPLLFELLNQMDGLADDADVLFLLTTNRPDLLEPALASRPGRIDQAIEVPLPDETCRRRLIELYGKGLTLKLSKPDEMVARTAGASAAFIRELLRRAALFAADETPERTPIVEDRHLDEALRELVLSGGQLTRNLLGFRSAQ